MSRFETLLEAARRRARPNIVIWIGMPSTKRSIVHAHAIPGKDPGHDFQA
ncbi:hypothetical protein HB777_06145 [Mesorhizobium loti]|nr:hypothetical protein HB777_06145 [Mesorhizobium loti]